MEEASRPRARARVPSPLLWVAGIFVLAVLATWAVERPVAAPTGVAFDPISIRSTGSGQLGPYSLPAGRYRFSWSSSGGGNCVVWADDGQARRLVIDEIPPNPPGGSGYYTSRGAEVVLEVQAPSGSWTLEIEPA